MGVARPIDSFDDTIRDLSNALDSEGISWVVAGGVAANHYRDQVRSTIDLDVMLSLSDTSVHVVQDALQRHGWEPIEVIEGWLLRAQHPVMGRLDVLMSVTEYEKGAIARSHQEDLDEDQTYKTLAIEDVLILKLIADRFQDNADVESILATQPALDWDYMTRWIEEFELDERLERIESVAIERGSLTERIKRESSSRGSTQGHCRD